MGFFKTLGDFLFPDIETLETGLPSEKDYIRDPYDLKGGDDYANLDNLNNYGFSSSGYDDRDPYR